MNLLHRLNRWIFRPKHCLRNGPDFYVGKFKNCQIMLMRRDHWWVYSRPPARRRGFGLLAAALITECHRQTSS